MNHQARAALACALGYCAITAVLGFDVLAHPSATVVHDTGDPLLTAAILHWNAWSLPFTHAWWQFPIFYPTPDALAFSEHLLGLSVVATPIEWISRDPVFSANVVTLLTYPLCAFAMFLLVRALTGSATGACLAGLAFGFSPYRVSQLPHVQMLAAFWAPLALLGLHAYLRVGGRRWLVLYAAAWLLQSLANGYSLVFFSILVGCWVVWFVVLPRRWVALRDIAMATLVAAVPLAPLLRTYVEVHARHGFARSLSDVQAFSADIGGVLCAPSDLLLWGWLRVACRPEGELFPGLVLTALVIAAWVRLLRPAGDTRPWMITTIVRGLALAALGVSLAAVASVLILGPWQGSVLGLKASVSSVPKPLLIAVAAALVALVTSRRLFDAARQTSDLGFYLGAAVVMWLFALGPTIILAGTARGWPAPFGLVMLMPGAASLRAPARFWLMTNLCLSVAAGLAASQFLGRARAKSSLWLAAVIGVGLLSDGWAGRIPVVPAPPPLPDAEAMRGSTVLTLPVGALQDFVPQFLAITGGWRSVNGYSGYEPRFYEAVRQGARFEVDGLFEPFVARDDLIVVVEPNLERQRELVERQPDVSRMGGAGGTRLYRLPRRPHPSAIFVAGPRRAIVRSSASCSTQGVAAATDGDLATRWVCGPQRGEEVFDVDLGEVGEVASLRFFTGDVSSDFPRNLVVETSLDGVSWDAARSGDVIAATIDGALADPRHGATTVAFAPRQARYVRLRQVGADDRANWAIAELEVRAGAPENPSKTY